jgi:hypothetical protein
VVATLERVRIFDGVELVAEHDRSCDRRQLVENPGIVEHRKPLGSVAVAADDHRAATGALEEQLIDILAFLLAHGFEREVVEDLAMQVERGTVYLKVFLEASELRARGGSASQAWRRAKISWPQDLLMGDACFTNAPGVWLAKHFYL